MCNETNKYRYLLHIIARKEYISRIQMYEHKFEQSANRSVQFSDLLKMSAIPREKTFSILHNIVSCVSYSGNQHEGIDKTSE